MSDGVRQVSDQVNDQAATQRDRLSQTLRSLGDDLEQMASQGPGSGMATDLAREVSERARALGSHLEGREPGQLLDEARDFARRRPGTFLLGALAAGVVAGRLFRATADGAAAATLAESGGPGATGGTVSPVPAGTSSFGTDGQLAGYPHVGDRSRSRARPRRPGRTRRPGVALGHGGPTDPGHAVTGASSFDPDVGTTAPSPAQGDDRSLGEIVGDISHDLTTLVKQELELAKTELKEEAGKAGKGAGLLGGAGVSGLLALIFLSGRPGLPAGQLDPPRAGLPRSSAWCGP